MITEVSKILAKAREQLDDARRIFGIDLYDHAAREAYLAAFHAAQAYVFFKNGKLAKTHSGLRSVFAQLSKENPAIERRFVRFLARGFEMKTAADYFNPDPVIQITSQEAEEAITIAADFIALIEKLCQ